MKKHIVPVLLTGDIDPSPEATLQDKKKCLKKTRMLFEQYEVRSTFFTVAKVGELLKQEVMELHDSGHEIGCHGLTHGFEEEYNRIPAEEAMSYLSEGTKILEDIIGEKVVSFRGPRVKTSADTQSVLEELGYRADSSVCSQRVDFISSNLINPNWITAPRMPYHPAFENAFRRGKRNLWVVPVSALMMPFVSGMLYTFGIGLVKMMFRILYEESVHTGKPIVYLFHPVEFLNYELSVKQSIGSFRVEGLRLRRSRWLFERDHNKRFEMNRELIAYMRSFHGVEFLTVKGYLKHISR